MKKTKLLVLPLVMLLAACTPGTTTNTTEIDVPSGYVRLPVEESDRIVPKFTSAIAGINENIILKSEESLKLNLDIKEKGSEESLIVVDADLSVKSSLGFSFDSGFELPEGLILPSIYIGADEVKGKLVFTVQDTSFEYKDLDTSFSIFFDASDAAAYIDFGNYQLVEMVADVAAKIVTTAGVTIDASTIMMLIKSMFGNSGKIKLDLDNEKVVELINLLMPAVQNTDSGELTPVELPDSMDRETLFYTITLLLADALDYVKDNASSLVGELGLDENFDFYKNEETNSYILLGNNLNNDFLMNFMGVDLGNAILDSAFLLEISDMGDHTALKEAMFNLSLKAENVEATVEEGANLIFNGEALLKSKTEAVFEDFTTSINKTLYNDVAELLVTLIESFITLQ